MKACAAAVVTDSSSMMEDSLIPTFGGPVAYDLPECDNATIAALLGDYKDLFRMTPGKVTGVYHHIPTSGSPAKVLPQRIPTHDKEKVEELVDEMLQQGIIVVPGSVCSGEVYLCVNYHELNKRAVKDVYPLPLPDEVQDHLVNSSVFTTLDLQNGYW